jgi:hypothetical protein
VTATVYPAGTMTTSIGRRAQDAWLATISDLTG